MPPPCCIGRAGAGLIRGDVPPKGMRPGPSPHPAHHPAQELHLLEKELQAAENAERAAMMEEKREVGGRRAGVLC